MDAVKRMFKVMPHSEYSKIIGSSSSKLLYAIATILAFAIPASSVNNPSVFYALAILAIITGRLWLPSIRTVTRLLKTEGLMLLAWGLIL